MDARDLEIVSILSKDGRATYQHIADRVGRSRTSVRDHVRDLLDRGDLTIELKEATTVAGIKVAATALIGGSGTAADLRDAVAKTICGPAAVVTGQPTVIAELRAASITALEEMTDRLRQLDGVDDVSLMVWSRVLRGGDLPRDAEPIDLDDIDHRLITLLKADGRAPFTVLSKKIDRSPAATSARVARLLHSRTIVIRGVSRPPAEQTITWFGARRADTTAAIAFQLADVPEITHLAAGHGRYELVGRIGAAASERAAVYDRLRVTSGLTDLTLWPEL